MGDQVWENLNEDAMPQLLGVILMTEFTPVVCRDKRLMEAFEHRNTLYGQRYLKTSVPNTSVIGRMNRKNLPSLTIPPVLLDIPKVLCSPIVAFVQRELLP